jgi:phage repressor protein C with HTH and peptisase S24 domain
MSKAATYAVRVPHSNMEPRHHAGHWVLYETDEAPIVGQDVLVEMVDGTRIVWRLDAIHVSAIEVAGYNPPVSMHIPLSDISALHPVLWSQRDLSIDPSDYSKRYRPAEALSTS